MKKIILLSLLSLSVFYACKKETKLFANNNPIKTINIKPNCSTILIANDEIDLDSVIIKTCTYKNFKSIATGNPSYNGKYYWEHELYESDQKVLNTEFFKPNYKDLEILINKQIKDEYESLSKNPELTECMSWVDFRYYNLNEMGISFNENNSIEFYIYYNIGSACDNVGGSLQSFKMDKISKYLK